MQDKTAEPTEQPAPPISSYCPDFSAIPMSAIVSLAKRYELGSRKYGPDAWRVNLKKIGAPYLIERLNHVIHHCLKMQAKIAGKIPWDKDDDAGAILWGGALAAEAVSMFYKDQIDPEAVVE